MKREYKCACIREYCTKRLAFETTGGFIVFSEDGHVVADAFLSIDDAESLAGALRQWALSERHKGDTK